MSSRVSISDEVKRPLKCGPTPSDSELKNIYCSDYSQLSDHGVDDRGPRRTLRFEVHICGHQATVRLNRALGVINAIAEGGDPRGTMVLVHVPNGPGAKQKQRMKNFGQGANWLIGRVRAEWM